MLQDFEYEDYKFAVLAADSREGVADAKAFITETGKRLGPDTVILSLRLGEDGRTVTMEYCSKETAEADHAGEGRWIRTCNSREYTEDRDRGTHALVTYTSGDRNVREYGKGTLADFFRSPSLWPEEVLHRLLDENGVHPLSLTVTQVYWQDLDDLGADAQEPAPVASGWTLSEDEDTGEPLNQRVCLYTCGDRRVYTRTDHDNWNDQENICQVFASLGLYTEGVPTLRFSDTGENRRRFLESLGRATAAAPTGDHQAFWNLLVKEMDETDKLDETL